MSQPASPPIRRRILRWIFRITKHLLALFGLAMLTYYGCFHLSQMKNRSMRPTLQWSRETDGDRVLTERLTYRVRSPRRWELITYRIDDGQTAVRRVVGLPGEFVQIRKGGQVVIDGRDVDQPPGLAAIQYMPVCNVHGDRKVECGDGYFVLGDAKMDVNDSRFEPPVLPDALVGRPWLIVTPWSRIRWIDHEESP